MENALPNLSFAEDASLDLIHSFLDDLVAPLQTLNPFGDVVGILEQDVVARIGIVNADEPTGRNAPFGFGCINHLASTTCAEDFQSTR